MTPKIAALPLPETVIDADFQNTLTVRLGSHKIATAGMPPYLPYVDNNYLIRITFTRMAH